MATPLTAARMLTVLRAEGCDVREYRSWRTHERDDETGLTFGPVTGVMIHHTVTSGTDGTLRLCYEGRTGLPGPLCHAVAAKDGGIHLLSNGRANHAGSGDDDVLRAVSAASYGAAPPAPNENNTDGNDRFYGIECINLGDGRDPWPEVQVDAMARWAAAICRAHGWSAKAVIGHKEWTNQKIDPRPSPGGADVSMTAFRARVARLLAGPPGAGSTNPLEDDMPLTNAELDEIAVKVLTKDGVIPNPLSPPSTNTHQSLATTVRNIEIVARRAEETVDEVKTKVDALTSLELTPEQVAQIAAAVTDAVADQVADKLAARLAE